jgi:hypothetical protein
MKLYMSEEMDECNEWIILRLDIEQGQIVQKLFSPCPSDGEIVRPSHIFRQEEHLRLNAPALVAQHERLAQTNELIEDSR